MQPSSGAGQGEQPRRHRSLPPLCRLLRPPDSLAEESLSCCLQQQPTLLKSQGKHDSEVELKRLDRIRGSEAGIAAWPHGSSHPEPADLTPGSPTRAAQPPGDNGAAKRKANAKKQLGKGVEIIQSCTAGNLLPSSHTHTVLLRVCLPINKATN